MRQRDVSIDIMKFLAVIAITNSHMDVLYGKFSYFATGGAIGDVLFFFVSGFTSLLGGKRTFGNYYKRRINRIYPTVFAWALITCAVFGRNKNFVDILLYGGGWFVTCIMVYYVVLFFIQRYFLNHLKAVFGVCFIIVILLYVPFADEGKYNMYGETYYKWCHYFLFMLQGALLGPSSKQKPVEASNGWMEILKAMICVVLFYGLCAFKLSESYNYIQVLSLLPLAGVTYYVYRWCNTKWIKDIYKNTKAGWCMGAIGGLCLEVYLVQSNLFTDKLNFMFPANILIIFLEILVVAYLVRCLSRIWSQTFKDADYNWKEVFKLVY